MLLDELELIFPCISLCVKTTKLRRQIEEIDRSAYTKNPRTDTSWQQLKQKLFTFQLHPCILFLP